VKPLPLTAPNGDVKAWQCASCSQIAHREEAATRCCVCVKCGKQAAYTGGGDELCLVCRDEARTADMKTALLAFEAISIGPAGYGKWAAWCPVEHDESPVWPSFRGAGPSPEAALADLRAKAAALKAGAP
jgi:hypothetical protein